MERERISLGLKQLKEDPFDLYLSDHPLGEMVSGKVIEIENGRVFVDLSSGVKGAIKTSEFDAPVNAGDSVEAYINGVDKKALSIALTIKPYNPDNVEKEEVAVKPKKAQSQSLPKNATIGDLLKEQIKTNKDK